MKHLYVLWLLLALANNLYAQDSANYKLPASYTSSMQSKIQDCQTKVERRTLHAINSAEHAEKQIIGRLKRADPVKAASLVKDCQAKYAELRSKVTQKVASTGMPTQFYNQYLDTIQGVFRYLGADARYNQSMQKALGDLSGLQQSLGTSDQIFEQLRDRQRSLGSELEKYTALTGILGSYQKKVYYCSGQVKEMKEAIQSPEKAERKAMVMLRKFDSFNRFLEKNSLLAGLFKINGSDDPTQALQGLQTRNQVEQAVMGRLGSDPASQQMATAQLNQAREQFSRLKSKFPNLDKASEMPNFKPNNLRQQSFIQRLKWGGNLEFKRANDWYPNFADMGAQVAYQLQEKKLVGIGVSYKVGFGTLDHLHYSHEGMGLRTFFEWRIKASYYFNGGAEMNHYQSTGTIRAPGNWNGWQKSALIGFSRKYKINDKLNSSIQVLYDLLATRQAPFNSPLLVRFNYSKN